MGNKIGQPEDRAETSRDPSQADNSLVGISPSKFLPASVNENFCNKQFWQHMKLQLPPTYVVRREDNVFTGVSLSVHRGGTTVPGSFPGLWSQVLSGDTPVPDRGYPCLSWGYPSPSQVPPLLGLDYPHLGLGYPPGWDWGTPLHPRDRRASTCYAAHSMPLAVRQEDYLFLRVSYR